MFFNVFWLRWVFIAVRRATLLQRVGFLLPFRGFSRCGAQGLEAWASGVSTWALELRLRIVVHRLSCSTAREILLGQGLNPFPLHSQADSYPLHQQGSP